LVITGWVVAVGLLTYLFYFAGRSISLDFFSVRGPLSGLNQAGQWVFDGMTLVLLTAVAFMVPGLTALSIVGERQRQTLHLLQITQVTPLGIVVGKMLSSIGYFLVLIVAVVPLLGIPLAFGAIGLLDVLVVMGMLVLVVAMQASISIWVSSRAKTNRAAVAMSYLLAVAIFFGSFVLMGVEALVFRVDMGDNGRELVSTWINPYVAVADAVAFPYDDMTGIFQGDEPTPMEPFKALVALRQGESLDGLLQGQGNRRIPGWIATTLSYGLIIALCLWRAARRVTAPRALPIRRKRARTPDASP
jgi:ABC-type transport system involved in multi-copper enzyme maturation permease subunit